jgi:membrane-associated phospholipid phosphatase
MLLQPGPAITARQQWFNRLIWYILAATIAVDAVWGAALGWTIEFSKLILLAECLLPVMLAAFYFQYRVREPRFVLMIHTVMQLILLVFASAGFNYVTSTLAYPLYDESFIAFDRLLGFDWQRYVDWVHTSTRFSALLSASYTSAWLQMLVIIILLFLTGRFARLQQFTFLVLVGALVSCALAALFPAVGGYVHYAIDPASFPQDIRPAVGIVHITDYLALREGRFNHIDLAFKGLITFPSYHSTFGIFLIYAFWPFKWVRIPVLAVNLLLIASTPVDGGHYLVDILGGVLVAFILIFWVRKLLPENEVIASQALEESVQGDYKNSSNL